MHVKIIRHTLGSALHHEGNIRVMISGVLSWHIDELPAMTMLLSSRSAGPYWLMPGLPAIWCQDLFTTLVEACYIWVQGALTCASGSLSVVFLSSSGAPPAACEESSGMGRDGALLPSRAPFSSDCSSCFSMVCLASTIGTAGCSCFSIFCLASATGTCPTTSHEDTCFGSAFVAAAACQEVQRAWMTAVLLMTCWMASVKGCLPLQFHVPNLQGIDESSKELQHAPEASRTIQTRKLGPRCQPPEPRWPFIIKMLSLAAARCKDRFVSIYGPGCCMADPAG